MVNEFKAGDEINLTNPVKEEFEFIGWYLDEVFTDTKKVINTKDLPNDNITLYAKWASIGLVSIWINGKEESCDFNGNLDIYSQLPMLNLDADETFLGLYYDAEYQFFVDLNTKPKDVIELYAKVGKGDVVFTITVAGAKVTIEDFTEEYQGSEYLAFPTTINGNLVTAIEDYAFYNCVKLIAIDFKNITSVGESVFSNCLGLESIK